MPVPPSMLPPDLADVFTTAHARALGVSASRLRAGDLDAPFSGVRVRRPAETDEDDQAPLAIDRAERARVVGLIQAYAPLMTPYSFVAGRSALVWHGVPVEHGDDLEIGVIEPDRAPRRAGIRARTLASHLVHVHDHDGLRVARPASSWAILGGELDERELVRLGDRLVCIPRDDRGVRRPERQLASLAQLRAAVAAGRRVGIARLRGAVADVRVGSMSPLETDARLEITAAGLPEPELDVEIRAGNGRLLGIADGAFRDRRVLLEIEGDHHRTSREQWDRDLEKYAAYAAAGWELVRLSSTHIRGPEPRAAALVRAALVRAGR